ncbi:MAG: SusC/RagA family TonB-linked outer membrane protein [Tannerellaceae bacterium]|jgi:TonB-linked SusC/RagA family outer membrane protein|nr:SusC/RagA family TonB-linked outer membrane protein [Tannerellaceae bacterium]
MNQIFFANVRTAALLLFCLCAFSLHAEHPNPQNVLITVNQINSRLEQVLNDIEKQSDYLFVYSKQVDVRRNVSLNVHKLPLHDALSQLFKDTDIRYEIEGSYVILSRTAAGKKGEAAPDIQQAVTVSGTVTDETGETMSGVNVVVKGTTVGAVTDADGHYSISVPDHNAVLVFSFLGYIPVEKAAGSRRILHVTMVEDSKLLDEVVVTALGIVRKEKSLTYSTQVVGGEELTRAKDPNMINSLAGKTAGVQINRSSSGLGGSVKVVIRGSRSVNGSNQPLYVIDGVPVNSGSNSSVVTTIGGNNDAGNRDAGDGISDLNPDDIESINILKGPAAAALYGTSAANGVVVISTKRGKAGRTDISFSSNTTWESATYGIPKFQNSYGGVSSSWGDRLSDETPRDYVSDFFRTGLTTINSLTLSSGSEAMQSYFSYANTYGKGVIELSELNKHNLNFRETANFFDGKLTVDANINLMYQQGKNRPSPGGYYLNPLVGLYHFPRGGRVADSPGAAYTFDPTFEYYKENYQYLDGGRNLYLQNWYTGISGGWEQNPYWIIHKTPNVDDRYRTLANLNLSFRFSDRLSVTARGNADFSAGNYEMKMFAGSDPALTGGNNGRYIADESNSLTLYGDVMLTYQQQFGDFTVNASLGASIKDYSGKSMGVDSYPAGLYNPNIFSINNINLNAGSNSMGKYHGQEQAVFFAGQLGFRDRLFLDVTARNDWTSTLAFTDYLNKGFFYPSVGLNWIANETFRMPEWINLGKIRGAWSKVGNGLPRYRSNPLNSVGRAGVINFNTSEPFSELQPEMTTSVETGTEWRLFGNRLEIDLTYYQTNTRNQLFSLSAPSGSKYTTYYVNAGNIQNRGVEIVLGGSPVWTGDFRWKTSVNYSHNRNKVIELAEGLDRFNFGGGGSNSYDMRLEVGGSFGDFYGRMFQRDEQGNIQYDAEGIPLPDKSDYKKIGNTAPDFNLGWQNTFTYKGVSLYFLVDGRFGGDVLSLTEADLDKYGVSKRSGDERLRGGVPFDGKTIENVERFYGIVGGRDGITEHYVYDATHIRLRELSVGYSLPRELVRRLAVVKGIDLSLIARNVFFILNRAPYDPDGTLSVDNGLQGVDVFGLPASRSLGFNLKINF